MVKSLWVARETSIGRGHQFQTVFSELEQKANEIGHDRITRIACALKGKAPCLIETVFYEEDDRPHSIGNTSARIVVKKRKPREKIEKLKRTTNI